MKRIPRPAGVTLQSIQIRNTKEENPLQRIKELLIEQWTNNNMQLNGQVMSTNQLANYLSMPESYIMKYMTKAMIKMGRLLNNVDGAELARALLSQVIKKGLEIQALSEAQVRILMASQGAEYQPFISMAVNQSLANLNGTQATLFNVFKAVSGGGESATNITIFNNQTNTQNKFLTTDEALKLIGPSQKSMIEDISQADAYITAQSSLPNVNARTQDLREIGIKYNGTETASAGLTQESPTTIPES